MPRLTSVANVKRYLAITSPGQDALIDKLIPTESLSVERYTARHFGFCVPTSRRINGTGTPSIVLPDQPIVAVSGLTVCGVALTASADGIAPGYVWDDTAVFLVGGAKFPPGVQNVAAVWSSGYQATENIVVPAASGNATTVPVELESYGFAMAANAVTYTANGVALAPVTVAPLVGQFSFADSIVTFNAADHGNAVTVVYPYAPSDVEQAVIEMVGLDLKQRDNLGVNSKSLAGESISYEKAGMSLSVKQMLQSYRRMAPA